MINSTLCLNLRQSGSCYCGHTTPLLCNLITTGSSSLALYLPGCKVTTSQPLGEYLTTFLIVITASAISTRGELSIFRFFSSVEKIFFSSVKIFLGLPRCAIFISFLVKKGRVTDPLCFCLLFLWKYLNYALVTATHNTLSAL